CPAPGFPGGRVPTTEPIPRPAGSGKSVSVRGGLTDFNGNSGQSADRGRDGGRPARTTSATAGGGLRPGGLGGQPEPCGSARAGHGGPHAHRRGGSWCAAEVLFNK